MPALNPQRMAPVIDGPFVVFLIGFRVNKWWKFHKWLPVFLAMPRILKELDTNKEHGVLATEQYLGVIVQYWRSFEHLERYARAQDGEHWPAWVAFNKRMGRSRGDVGIWHETFLVEAGKYEAIYSAMPPKGLGKAGRLIPASGRREAARGRIDVQTEEAGKTA